MLWKTGNLLGYASKTAYRLMPMADMGALVRPPVAMVTHRYPAIMSRGVERQTDRSPPPQSNSLHAAVANYCDI